MAATTKGITLCLGDHTIALAPVFNGNAGQAVTRDLRANLQEILGLLPPFFENDGNGKGAWRAIFNTLDNHYGNLSSLKRDEIFDSWITPTLKLITTKIEALTEKHFNAVYKKNRCYWNGGAFDKLKKPFSQFAEELKILVQVEVYLAQNIFSKYTDHRNGPDADVFKALDLTPEKIEAYYLGLIKALVMHCHLIIGNRITEALEQEINKETPIAIAKYTLIYVEQGLPVPHSEDLHSLYIQISSSNILTVYRQGMPIASIPEAKLFYSEVNANGVEQEKKLSLKELSQTEIDKMKVPLMLNLSDPMKNCGVTLNTNRRTILEDTRFIIGIYLCNSLKVALSHSKPHDYRKAPNYNNEVWALYSETLQTATRQCYKDLSAVLRKLIPGESNLPFFSTPSSPRSKLSALIRSLNPSKKDWQQELVDIINLAEITSTDEKDTEKMEEIIEHILKSPVWKSTIEPSIQDISCLQELRQELRKEMYNDFDNTRIAAKCKEEISTILGHKFPGNDTETAQEIYQSIYRAFTTIEKNQHTHSHNLPKILNKLHDIIINNETYWRFYQNSISQLTR